MKRSLFDYELPADRIAVHPLEDRDGARLMVLDAGAPALGLGRAPEHARILGLEHLIEPGTVMVVNDTRVIAARLFGRKLGSGGRVEILLVRRRPDGSDSPERQRWTAFGRSSKPLRGGARIVFDGDAQVTLEGQIVERSGDGRLIDIDLASNGDGGVDVAIGRLGHVPLPPYLHREATEGDRTRYQTVFARVPGAVAAPTAGLHLSGRLLDRLRARGVIVATVTLHVGPGTFEPVTADDLDDHPMHSEAYEVSEGTAESIAAARRRGARVLAVGTTTVRALESAADPECLGLVRPCEGETRLLIQPGYRFRVVDDLLTNFHLPGSTLVALVSAFAGREWLLHAYALAIREGYRFLSYGDAMLVRGQPVGPTAARGLGP